MGGIPQNEASQRRTDPSQVRPWDPRVPFTVRDLGAEGNGLEGRRLGKVLHQKALEVGAETYIDPASGYNVFTEVALRKRPCCGNRCRHCPYGHVNVPKLRKKNIDW
mmetsp:Transcript_37409/g.62978  ORF Transcript_37409/g.62978 Transcript_37409/m.62978 type:complete len:107 (+) Transcript_37409:323-643(+)